MERNSGRNGPRNRFRHEVSIGRSVTHDTQRWAVAVGLSLFWIDFVVIGREYGILRGADGLMNGIVSAAAADTGMDTVTFAAVSMVQVGAVKWSLYAAHPRQERAGENDTQKQSGDYPHILIHHVATIRNGG